MADLIYAIEPIDMYVHIRMNEGGLAVVTWICFLSTTDISPLYMYSFSRSSLS